MSDMRNGPTGDPSQDAVTRALRSVVAPPMADEYWDGLHDRVMAGIRSGRGAALSPDPWDWTTELTGWVRPALVAAAALLLLAGTAMFRTRQAEQRLAYDALLAPTPIPTGTALRPSLQGDRDATLHYLLAH